MLVISLYHVLIKLISFFVELLPIQIIVKTLPVLRKIIVLVINTRKRIKRMQLKREQRDSDRAKLKMFP